MNLTIEARDIGELKTKIRDIAEGLGVVQVGGSQVTAPAEVEEAPAKKTRAKKEKAEAVTEAPVVTPPSPEITKEMAIEALKAVGSKRSIGVAKEILESLKAGKVSDLSPDQYPSLLEKCNQAMANA